MSLPPQLGSSSAFYIGDDGGEVDHQELMLETANSLASQDCLKESTDWLSMAVRYGPVRPEQLSTFVDCIVRNFKRKTPGCEAAAATTQGGEPANFSLDCPNCLGFLSDPVTLACGHSYCRRCLQRRLLSKCKVCSEPVRGGEKASVVLCGLLHKWFPEDAKKSKTLFQIDELGRKKQYEAAIALATDVAQSDPHLSEMARLSRAESYLALKQYGLALEDSDVSPHSTCSAEAFYWKAMVLHDMGQVDESLQVFLHSLALNDDFPCAKWQVAKIICDLLSLANESVTVGLRETTQSTSPRLRSKTLVADAQMSPQKHNEEAPQHETRAALPHGLSNPTLKRRCESVERHGLTRAHSLRSPGSGFGEECLKRVCSAPQLGDQEKASLLKRKLSDAEPCVVDSWGGKPKKQGLTSRQDAATTKRIIPEHLLDPNDLECSLCMRLLYEPVTTPCGHTFCKNCLERCLDHTAQCPLCKESLKEYLAGRRYVITSVLDTLIKEHLRQEHAERATVHLEETREFSDLTRNVPIFVCTMAYPTVPCPLHVFEPRYRLMIRRCMDTSTQQFGMCIQDPQKGFADYGCMLFIRSVHFLPDGRSVVDTVGGKRFRVLTRGMRDGYSIADIEHLEDTKVEDGEELKSLQQLHDAVYEQARVWFQNLKIRFHNQILQHFGPMPGREDDIQATVNGPACCWWLLAVLPIDPRYQLSVLSMTSLRERLEKIQQILTYLQSIPNN